MDRLTLARLLVCSSCNFLIDLSIEGSKIKQSWNQRGFFSRSPQEAPGALGLAQRGRCSMLERSHIIYIYIFVEM